MALPHLSEIFPLLLRPGLIAALTLGTVELAASTAAHKAALDSKEEMSKGRDKSGTNDKKTKGGVPGEGVAGCRLEGSSVALPDLPEASGLAASRRTPGIFWSHLDSGAASVLVALDAKGSVKGKVRLSGVTLADWEDVAVSSCGGSSCVYVADIGDNRGTRGNVTVYRFPEPLATDAILGAPTAFEATFPDGAQDAEALFVLGEGEMFIVTKGDTGPVALYRFPPSVKGAQTPTLQKVGVLRGGKVAREGWITGASASADGRWVVLRTHGEVTFYDASKIARGDFGSPLKFSVSALKEPQGEGIAFGQKGRVFLAGEGGGKSAAGTFGSFVCNLPGVGAPSVR